MNTWEPDLPGSSPLERARRAQWPWLYLVRALAARPVTVTASRAALRVMLRDDEFRAAVARVVRALSDAAGRVVTDQPRAWDGQP